MPIAAKKSQCMVGLTILARVVITACFLLGLPSCAFNATPHGSQPRIEVAFGPKAGAESLVLKSVGVAKQTIRLSAFALSSPKIIEALVDAKQRGVDVQAVVDFDHNVGKDPKCIGRNALAALAKAGVAIRTNDHYRKMHDKFVIIDGRYVQTGSYNYASSANQNSENVLVVWGDPALADAYLRHWQSRFDEGSPLKLAGDCQM